MFLTCPDLAVPISIMRHVVNVESSGNPYAIGVVKGQLVRQPRNLNEAVATAKMLESRGFNFSVGIAQVNRYNLKPYGLHSYEHAFQVCPNLQAGSRILKACYDRAQHWGKAFSCYYSGNFVTGYKQGYVQKIVASMQREQKNKTSLTVAYQDNNAIAVIDKRQQKISTPISQQNSIKPTIINTTVSNINTMPQNQNTPMPAQKNDSLQELQPSNNRKAGIAEITPKVYTDSAFVF